MTAAVLGMEEGPRGLRAVEQKNSAHRNSGKIYAPVPFWFGSLRSWLMHTRIEFLQPLHQLFSTFGFPTACTLVRNHGCWKVSIYAANLGNDNRQPEIIGTRDSPRARRALRRRPWTLSPERTGTLSRYVQTIEKKIAFSLKNDTIC